MEYIKNNSDVLIVCCVHGDEQFGLDVFDHFFGSGVSLLLANEEAIEDNVRYKDTDLNRCFPGNIDSNLHEERLAAQILPIIKSHKIVLDIHTTTSDMVMTPIISKRNEEIDAVIRKILFPREVVLIPEPYAIHSLINQVECGISLEFGELYAKENTEFAIMMIEDIISGANNKSNIPTSKDLYIVCGTLKHKLENGENFGKIADMFYNGSLYSFLVDERAYEKVGNHGLICYKEPGVLF